MTQYLAVDALISINANFGGDVIDLAGIESAAFRPRSGAYGEEAFPSIWEKAAAYIHGLATTQYFSDGNKRTAWIAANVFLDANGYELAAMPDIESETFVQAVAQRVFDTEDDRDATLRKAAEWIEQKWLWQRRGAALDPRLEYVVLALGAAPHSIAEGDNLADIFAMGVRTITVVAEGGAAAFPYQQQLTVVGQLRWNREDGERTHRVRATVLPEPGGKRVNRRSVDFDLSPTRRSAHPADQPSGLMPQTFLIHMTPVFLAPGMFTVVVELDGVVVAQLPIVVGLTAGVPDFPPAE
ncbi:type II toxin-antitoxin system death-on-curing family toxin [Mycobacterium marinum]|uniref:type II toxin-antitoxin system death-on-curing family toxin n=1 Tax=Mycobacterium marinum TaxID=1781 RepID=UPI00192398AC|nr:type II toxin-antitoxin system death-on-curing family toxin [Mycobacterium marinum]QQW36301.1 type II toxin-antitoxin system death-on-curing family toxin [Mycobacterium marinum]